MSGKPGSRGHVHNTATAVEQKRQSRLAHQEGSGEVHLEDEVPLLKAEVVGIVEVQDARDVA